MLFYFKRKSEEKFKVINLKKNMERKLSRYWIYWKHKLWHKQSKMCLSADVGLSENEQSWFRLKA